VLKVGKLKTPDAVAYFCTFSKYQFDYHNVDSQMIQHILNEPNKYFVQSGKPSKSSCMQYFHFISWSHHY